MYKKFLIIFIFVAGILTAYNVFGAVYVPPSPAPILNLWADSYSITQYILDGNPETTDNIRWSTAYATSCTASGGWSGVKDTLGILTITPTATATYSMTCIGSGGSITKSITINVTSVVIPPGQTCQNPGPAVAGYEWILTGQNSQKAGGYGSLSCNWTGGICDASNINKTGKWEEYSGPPNDIIYSTANYICRYNAPAPTITLTASPTLVALGGASTLTWSATNATSCTASGDWSGTKATSGSQSTSNLTSFKTYTYSLSCTGAGGTALASATVTPNVLPAPTQCSAVAYQYPSRAIVSGWDNNNGSESYSISRDNNDNIFSYIGSVDGPSGSGPFSYGDYSIGSGWHKYKIVACDVGAGTHCSNSCITNAVQVPLPAPTLNLTASPSSLTVVQNGASKDSAISTIPVGITDAVNYEYKLPLNSGLTAYLTNKTNSGTTLTVSGTIAGGPYPVIVTGFGNGRSVTGSTTVSITVTAPPSGTLSSPDCIIASGSKSCNVAADWSITNPQTIPTAITASGMANINVSNSLATSQFGTQSVTVPYPSRTFYLYNNGQLLAQDLQQASCVSGTAWDGSKCAPPMSGTLTGVSSCIIPSGGSTCSPSPSLNWGITNPVGNTTAITWSGGASTVSNSLTPSSQSGTQSVTVPYPSRTFSLYNNGVELASKSISASCGSNVWNGLSCSPPPFGTLSATSCIINIGGTSCSSTVSWEVLNPTFLANTEVKREPPYSTISTDQSGTKIEIINYGNTNFNLYHNGLLLRGPVLAKASCPNNTTWNGTCALNTFTLTINTAGNGSGTAGPAGTYNSGTVVTLTNSPNVSSNFAGWSGDADCTDGSVTMNSNKTCTANFTLKTFTLSYSAGTGGTISGTTFQTVNYGANGTAVTAVPNSGYSFSGWSDGISTATRTDTNVTTNKSVTATFTFIPIMSGTLSATDCTILVNASSCNSTIVWTTTNPVGTSVVTSSYPSANTTIATANSGTQLVSIPYVSSPRAFYLYNNGQLLAQGSVTAQDTATASCASGTAWNGSICTIPPTVSISANPTSIAYSGISTITWSSTNATSCTGSGGNNGWSGARATSGNRSSGNLTTTTTFTLTCINGTLSAVGSVTIIVGSAPVNGVCSSTHYNCTVGTSVGGSQNATTWTWGCNGSNGGTNASCSENKSAGAVMSGVLNANPSPCYISAGNSSCDTTLTWKTINPIGISAITSSLNNSGISYPNFTVATGNSGGMAVLIPHSSGNPLLAQVSAAIPRGSRDFYLYNNGELIAPRVDVTSDCIGGTFWQNGECTIIPSPPTASISLSSGTITSGDPLTITWSSTNATSCTGTGFNTGGITSGSVVVYPTTTTTYSLSCDDGATQAFSQATVTVSATKKEPKYKEN